VSALSSASLTADRIVSSPSLARGVHLISMRTPHARFGTLRVFASGGRLSSE
jgi:hypothetical protein